MNNSTQERGVWGALWHIAGTNLPAARGSAEWTQLGGWCGARAGAPWRQTDTAKELRQRKKKKSTAHKHSDTHSHVLLSLSHSCLSLPHQGKAGACQGYATPGCQLQLLSIARVCFFSFFFFFLLCCGFFSDFLFLASVALLRVHVHAVSPPPPTPSMTRASHSARWTSRLANLPDTPSMRSWSCHGFEKTNGISATWQLCANTFWWFGVSSPGKSGALIQLSRI